MIKDACVLFTSDGQSGSKLSKHTDSMCKWRWERPRCQAGGNGYVGSVDKVAGRMGHATKDSR